MKPATRMTRQLLIATALLEAATGIALLVSPSGVASLLLGAPLDTPSGLRVAQVAGGALLALGLACWLARNDAHSLAARGIVLAMLLYNVTILTILAYAKFDASTSAPGFWLAAGTHALLTAWCVASVRTTTAPPSHD